MRQERPPLGGDGWKRVVLDIGWRGRTVRCGGVVGVVSSAQMRDDVVFDTSPDRADIRRRNNYCAPYR